MKKIFILIVILVAGYIFYKNYYNVKPYEIKANIVVAQASGMDMNGGSAPGARYAHIEGVIKNIGDKSLRNVLIKYNIDRDTLSAAVDMLAAGSSLQFTTNTVIALSSNPRYKLVDVGYEFDEAP